MILEIPFRGGVAGYNFSTTISAQSYTFDVLWNPRDLAWYFDLSDPAGNLIATGVKIVLGAFLGRRAFASAPFNAGVVVAVDTTNQGREATFDDLGTRVIVQYMPVEDLLARIGLATQ